MAKSRVEKMVGLAEKLEKLVGEASDEELEDYALPMWLRDSLIRMELDDRSF